MGNKLVFQNQHAYTAKRGTDTAISEVLNYAEANSLIGNKEHCVATFIDIIGAFDHAPYHHIIDAMMEAEAPIEFVRFYKIFSIIEEQQSNLVHVKKPKNWSLE